MKTIPTHSNRISAIIPAYNEAKSIRSIIEIVLIHPHIAEVIVVDDGSYDGTASIAKDAGAIVISHKRNRGKAAAMETGVLKAHSEIFFFIDADIIGLSHEAMTKAINSVVSRESDMFVLVTHRMWIHKHFSSIMPLLSGIRVLRREVWNCVPTNCKNRFEIELALNYFASKNKYKITSQIVPNLTQTVKEKKRGVLRGLYQRIFMIRDITIVILKMYVYYNFKYIAQNLARKLQTLNLF